MPPDGPSGETLRKVWGQGLDLVFDIWGTVQLTAVSWKTLRVVQTQFAKTGGGIEDWAIG